MRFNSNIFNDLVFINSDEESGEQTWFLPHDSLLYQALWNWFGYGPESDGDGMTMPGLTKKLGGKYQTDYIMPNDETTEGIELTTGSGNPIYTDLIGWNNKYKFLKFLNEDK